MSMTLAKIAAELSPVVKKALNEGAKAYTTKYQDFMNVENSTDYYWEELETGAVGFLQNLTELNDVPQEDFNYGATKQYKVVGYGLAIVASREVLQYQRLGIVTQAAKMLGMSVKKTYDYLAVDLLNRGATVHTTPDAAFLFSQTHTNLAGGTYANRPAAYTDFSLAALNNAYYNMVITKRHDVTPGANMPEYVWYHPYNASTVHAVLNSEKITASANNDSNFMFKRLKPIELPLLSNVKSWGLLSAKEYHSLKMVKFMNPKFSQWYQESNKSGHYDVITDVDVGATGGLGIWGEFPT